MRVSNHLTHNLLILVGTCIYSVFCLRFRCAFPISSISIPDGLGSGLLQFPAICEGKTELFDPFPQSTLYVYNKSVCIYIYICICINVYINIYVNILICIYIHMICIYSVYIYSIYIYIYLFIFTRLGSHCGSLF